MPITDWLARTGGIDAIARELGMARALLKKMLPLLAKTPARFSAAQALVGSLMLKSR